MILGRLYLLLKGKLGIDTAVLVSDRYDVAHSKKQFERARWETIRDGIAASYKTSGKHTVPNYHKSLRRQGNKAAVAEFNSIYTLETAPKLLNDQSILLVGVFKMVHIQRAHNAAITGEKGLYSSQKEADTRMLLHAIAATTTHQCVVSCDDTDVIVLPLYYYSKKKCYLNKVHVGKYTHRGRFVPIHAIYTKP